VEKEGFMVTEACVDEDTVLAFACRSLPAERAALVERHLDRCADCVELVAAAAREIAPPRSRPPGQQQAAVDVVRPVVHQSFGRYRILDVLGFGGMGVVYRAIDERSGEAVALKTVRVQEPGAVASIRREIHALSRVRHPGVVRILEQGLEAGYPWYAMEFIAGQTLEAYLEATCRIAEQAAPIHADPRALSPLLRARLSVLEKLSSTLAYLHGWGLVHRDLTPLNVMIRPDDTPVLVDFGLAFESVLAGRDVLGRADAAGGTAAYMAPEQILAAPVDARADLYALGCILYQAVAGRPPFAGATGSALLFQHVNAAPVPPSALVPGIPPRLDALILRLLAKRACDRTGYAEDVETALAAVLADDLGAPPGVLATGRAIPSADIRDSAGQASSAPGPGARPRAYAYRPLFSGRDDWIETFDALLERLRRGTGGQIYVGGESGIGKTRLIAEVADRARRRGLRIITGECAAMSAAASEDTGKAALHPLRPLLRAIAEVCRAGGPERTSRLIGARAKVLAVFEPGLRDLPGQDAISNPPELPAQAGLHRILSALEDTLAVYAEEAPVLLIIDDLQWADELSLRFFESLRAEFFDRHPVFVIGTYRAEEKSAAIARLIHAPGAIRVSLGRLPLPVIRAMISDMLALDAVPAEICDVLARESEGNPFFISEYVRAAVEEGWLERKRGGTWAIARSSAQPLPLPTSLKELTERRLSALSPLGRQVMEGAAVLGRESDGEMILATAGVTGTDSLAAIQELVTRCVIEELPRGRLRFAHDKLREAAYDRLGPERRRMLHRRAAAAIEQLAPKGPSAALLYPVLAHHWSVAHVFDKAVAYLEKAGEAALATGSYGETAAFFEHALDLSRRRPPTEEEAACRARWERRLGEAYYALGDLPRCEQHSRVALASFGHPLPSSRAGWALSLAVEAAVQAVHLLRPSRAAERAPEQRAALKEAAVTAARITHRYYFADDGLPILASSLLAVNLVERAGVTARVARPYAQACSISVASRASTSRDPAPAPRPRGTRTSSPSRSTRKRRIGSSTGRGTRRLPRQSAPSTCSRRSRTRRRRRSP
jgi:eukaryotic-like serine/threonine-protein kinase